MDLLLDTTVLIDAELLHGVEMADGQLTSDPRGFESLPGVSVRVST